MENTSNVFSGRFYWFDIRSLKRDLVKATAFNARSNYAYAMATAVMLALANLVSQCVPQEAQAVKLVHLIAALVGLAATVWGVNLTYEANGGNEGKHFFDRTIPLAWVWGLWFSLVTLLPVVAIIVVGAFWFPDLLGNDWIWMMAAVIWEVAYYVTLAKHVKDVAQGTVA